MANKQELFYSAIASLFVYLILIVSFLLYVKTSEVKKIEANLKSTVLQLDIVLATPEKKVEKKIVIKSEIENQDFAEKVVKKTSSSSLKQRSDLKSLFANVDTEITKVTKEKVLNIKKSTISSRFKSKFEKEKKTEKIVLSQLTEKVEQNLETNTKSITMEKSKEEQDPYYSEIYQILSKRWVPTVFSDDLKAKVSIMIFSNGKFSYKFIQYSGNTGFDTQLERFLNNETLKSYPVSPSSRTVHIEIVFQSKG